MIAAVTALLPLLLLEPQEPITVHEDIQYSDVARQARRNRLDLYVPAASSRIATSSSASDASDGKSAGVELEEVAPPLVMFVHGGSWTGGHKGSYHWLGEALVGHGYACAVINTQLFPFAKPDEMVADCGQALGYLYRHAAELGFDGDRLFVMGHSSGAHLCSWLAFDQDQLKAAGVPNKALRGSVLLSGVYDIRSRHIALDAVFGSDDEYRRRATTLLYADKADAPVFIAWADHDLPCLALCARMLRDRLQDAGVPVLARQYSDCNHKDYVFGLARDQDRVMGDVLRFLRDPTKAATPRVAQRKQTLLWVATSHQEHEIGEALAAALHTHGVYVVVQDLAQPTSESVSNAYRKLRGAGGKAMTSCYVGGIGLGGALAASVPLTAAKDGLSGRIAIGASLSGNALAKFSKRPVAAVTDGLYNSRLLSVLGDQDPKSLRDQSMRLSMSLMRRGQEAHLVELPNTTAEAAFLKLRPGDSLLIPMLLAFLYP